MAATFTAGSGDRLLHGMSITDADQVCRATPATPAPRRRDDLLYGGNAELEAARAGPVSG